MDKEIVKIIEENFLGVFICFYIEKDYLDTNITCFFSSDSGKIRRCECYIYWFTSKMQDYINSKNHYIYINDNILAKDIILSSKNKVGHPLIEKHGKYYKLIKECNISKLLMSKDTNEVLHVVSNLFDYQPDYTETNINLFNSL